MMALELEGGRRRRLVYVGQRGTETTVVIASIVDPLVYYRAAESGP